MSKLTQKDDQGNWCLKGVRWEQLRTGSVITEDVREKLYAALWRLMEYEDTGFSPEQIYEMCDLYGEKCDELAEEKEKHRWIPVEERLPKEDIMVLVSCKSKNGSESINRAYHARGFWNGSGSMSGVLAWMPLPEPYRSEKLPEVGRPAADHADQDTLMPGT